ncbi:MAG: T9SS type A sorting domain-containing protein [Bacteroidetes bacterium]|nr:T9SS type A sorting domain-containing protein [Bacteroidota bacterium]
MLTFQLVFGMPSLLISLHYSLRALKQTFFFLIPVSTTLTVEFEIDKTAIVQFSMCDFTGKEIICPVRKKLLKGRCQENVNMEQLKAGIYLYIININGQVHTMKIIKK